MPSRAAFRRPQSVDETEACFIVRDRNGFALSNVYYNKKQAGDRRPLEDARRSAADCGQYRQAAGVGALYLPTIDLEVSYLIQI